MPKATKKKRKQQSPNKNIFLNQYVLLTLGMNINKVEQNEDGAIQYNKPIQLKGYLIKEDAEKLYLGDDPSAISFYIKKHYVAYVECIAIIDELDEKLDELKDGISN